LTGLKTLLWDNDLYSGSTLGSDGAGSSGGAQPAPAPVPEPTPSTGSSTTLFPFPTTTISLTKTLPPAIFLYGDSFLVGNEDAFIEFMKDSATFGSLKSGSNFTVTDLVVAITSDNAIMLTNTGRGTITFNEDTVVFGSTKEVDEDLVISVPVYAYDEKGQFTITGSVKGCDSFGLTFDAEGLIIDSIECGSEDDSMGAWVSDSFVF